MKLRTEISLGKSAFEVNHESKILLIGSCFSENIGNLLKSQKFETLINPLGISYNPISVSNLLERYSNFRDNEFIEGDGYFFNFQLHSKFNSVQKKTAISKSNKALKQQKEFLKESDTVFISYGSAWVHELTKTQETVNNCHKQPKRNFRRRLLSVKEINKSIKNTIAYLNRISKKEIHIVFTVSPIRHTKDGIHENQLSKSTLQLAIHEVCQEHNNCSYFPSYEIMMDDLRDYRFYEPDLIHPNKVAIEYIWEKISEAYFSKTTKSLNSKIQGFKASVTHRPFNIESDQHQTFLKKLIQQLSDFQNQEKIYFQEEIESLEKQLIS
jgi:hypothetical protein